METLQKLTESRSCLRKKCNWMADRLSVWPTRRKRFTLSQRKETYTALREISHYPFRLASWLQWQTRWARSPSQLDSMKYLLSGVKTKSWFGTYLIRRSFSRSNCKRLMGSLPSATVCSSWGMAEVLWRAGPMAVFVPLRLSLESSSTSSKIATSQASRLSHLQRVFPKDWPREELPVWAPAWTVSLSWRVEPTAKLDSGK